MLEIIFLSILSIIIIKKLLSILGKEHDQMMFGNKNIIRVKKKNAIDFNKNIFFKDFEYLNHNDKNNLIKIFEQDNSFDIKNFITITERVVTMLTDAYSKQDLETLKQLTTDENFKIFKELIKNNEKNNIFEKIYVVRIEESKLIKVKKDNNLFEIKISFQMQQIHYTENDKQEIISGTKEDIIHTKENWLFIRYANQENKSWFIKKIEVID